MYTNNSTPLDNFVSPHSFPQEQRWQKRQPDSYTLLHIRPNLREGEQITHSLQIGQLLPDIVCFPGNIRAKTGLTVRSTLAQFAACGHRIFYVSPESFLKNEISLHVGVKTVEPNLTEVLLAGSSFVDLQAGDVDVDNEDTLRSLLTSLGELRTLYRIDECILYVLHPGWGRLAHAAQQKWGWRIIYDLAELETSPVLQQSAHQLLLKHASLVVASPASQIANLASERLLIYKPEQIAEHRLSQSIYTQYAATVPLASIIIVTYNNLAYTQLCIESILRNTEYPNYEIIVVDNNSSDGTISYLRMLEQTCSNVRVILNDKNYGFAKGNNLGLERARGEYLVLLNNDTIVPPGWLSRLLRHLEDHEVGIVGPRSNSVGNSAKVDVDYTTWGEMETFAQTNNWTHDNQVSNIHMLGMFCVALRRDIYEKVGPLDEQFGLGTFEDDDYCLRIHAKGYRIVCAFDVFVHHFGSATFLKYVNLPEIYQVNQLKFEEKWGQEWLPYVSEILIPLYHAKVDFMLSENEQNQLFKISLSEYENKVALLNQILAKREQEVNSLNQEVNSLNAHLLSIYMSTSWKITRPIRFLKRFVQSPQQALYELLRYFWAKLPEQIRTKTRTKLQAFKHNLSRMMRRIKGIQPDLSWKEFNQKVLAHRDIYTGIFIQEPAIDWNVPLYQRPQHLAVALAELGYLVIYKLAHTTVDDVNGYRQVAKNVWVTNLPVDEIEYAVHSVYSTAYPTADIFLSGGIKKIKQNGIFVYEYIDHISPLISGNDENVQKLLKLKMFALQNADFIVVSARKLEQEVINERGKDEVLYIPNGVDVQHYRNPRHQEVKLPDRLSAFREKYPLIVGYFGALAPWLWYPMLAELTQLRTDIGFVFIGPDYLGGASQLPNVDNLLYLGSVDYNILPAYGRSFDVCFIPFAPGEIARTTSPLKLFEYFALEKPVVTTSFMDECVVYDEVFSGESASEISKAIDKAVQVKDNPEYKARLARLAEQNSWEERAKVYERIFQAHAEYCSKNPFSLARVQNLIIKAYHKDGVENNYYESVYSKQEFLYWLPVIKWISDLPQLSSVIDIGAAYGTLLLYTALNKSAKKLHVIDAVGYISKSLIEDFDIQFHRMDFEREEFNYDDTFDLILFTEVIEHLNFYPDTTLQKIKKLMNQNSYLIISTPDAADWGRQTKYYFSLEEIPRFEGQNSDWIDGHIWQYTKQELETVLLKNGFQIEKFAYAPGASGKKHLCFMLKIRSQQE